MKMSGLAQVEMSGSDIGRGMPSALLTMTRHELDRVELMRRIQERRITQAEAAAELQVSVGRWSGSIARIARPGPLS
jgi:hypothetical protein